MRKYKITLKTEMETDSLDIIKNDIEAMDFISKEINIDEMMNADEKLVEETNNALRKTKSFLKIEDRKIQ